MTQVHTVTTTRGPARLHEDSAAQPWLSLVLGHGAGGGVAAPDLQALATTLPGQGVSVWRVEQPWRVAGRRVAAAPAVLDDAWTQVLAALPDEAPRAFGGRSAGARVACRTASALGAVAVAALAFPLHPPGRPGRSRAHELDQVTCPTLVVQGERDAFGTPDQVPTAPGRTVVAVPGDHALKADPDAVVRAVAAFLDRLRA
jgi:predicted alpha/beta-hydrolase family hydrolase